MDTVVTYVVGSRGSALAKAQVRGYITLLRTRFPDIEFVQRVITEDGDHDRKSPLPKVSAQSGGSAFSSHQEAALARGEVDFVVHSLKDVPTSMAPGLMLLPPPGREDPRDALCGSTLAGLLVGARVGTGSPRRQGQLLALRPARIVPVRGNVPPRLRMLRTMDLDAVVLAAAGLNWLGLAHEITELLPLDACPPSPGQGALGIQVREDSTALQDVLRTVGDANVDAEVRAERALLAELHGGCNVPVGAYAETQPDRTLTLHGQVTSLDGPEQINLWRRGPASDPESLGKALAAELADAGAHRILNAVRSIETA